MVEQTTRRRNDDIRTFFNLIDLFTVADTTVDEAALWRAIFTVRGKLILDLSSELASGAKHEATRRRALLVASESMQDGQRVGSSLASTGLRRADNIAALKNMGNRSRLNRSRLFKAEFVDRFKDRLIESKFVEGHN